MRITLLLFQLLLVATLYSMVALPVIAVVSGLVYALVVAAEAVLIGLTMGLLDVLFYVMPPLFPSVSGAAGASSIVVTAATAISQAATVLGVVSIPMLAGIVVNLVCGFLTYYGGWYKAMRRWGLIGNFVALACYLIPQLVFIGAMFYHVIFPPSHGIGMSMETVLAATAIALAWDSYFFISVALFYYMPERPDAALTRRRAPAAQLGLCLILAAQFALTLWLIGSALGRFVIIALCVIFVLSVFLVLVNARASKRIVKKRQKLFALLTLTVNVAATVLGLVFMPPVGVVLLMSLALLYFLGEVAFFGDDRNAENPDPRESVPATV